MQNSNPVQAELLYALRNQMLPWLNAEGGMRLLLAEPPVLMQPGVKILGYRPPLPKAVSIKPPALTEWVWPKQSMAATRYAGFGCILEGEADFAFGTNTFPPTGETAPKYEPGIEVVTLQERTLFVLPPGVPRTSGQGPHWERPCPEKASSRVFWAVFLPGVTFCHICSTKGSVHASCGVITIEDSRLEALMQTILEELRARSKNGEPIGRHLLSALLLRIERDLDSQTVLPGRQMVRALPAPPGAGLLVQSVCRFMHHNMNEPLTLAGIASQHHVSPSQLNRRFQAEIGMSVIEYLIHCRIETAKHLLTESGEDRLVVRQVAGLVGFPDTAYFGRVFKKRVGATPTEFRERSRQAPEPIP